MHYNTRQWKPRQWSPQTKAALYGAGTVYAAIRVRGGIPYLPVAVEVNGRTFRDEAVLPVPLADVAKLADGVHQYHAPAAVMSALRGRLVLPGRKQVAHFSWPRGVRQAPRVLLKDWDESLHPRGPDGRFGGGGDSEPNAAQKEHEDTARRAAAALAPVAKALESTEEGRGILAKGAAIAAKVSDSIRSGVAAGVHKALEGLDEESHGGVSLIQGGITGRSPMAVAHGIAQLVGIVYESVHQELYETCMADHSISGAHAIGKVGGKVAAAGEKAVLAAVAWAALKAKGLITGKDFVAWIDEVAAMTKAVGDNGSGDDIGGLPPAVRDALVQVAVEQTLEALHLIDDETGGALPMIPGDDAIEARVRRLMDGRL